MQSAMGGTMQTHCHFKHTGGAEAVKRRCGFQAVGRPRTAAFLEERDSQVTAASGYGSRMRPLRVDHPIGREPSVVRYTPEDTSTAPMSRDTVRGSPRIRNARNTALTGTKLMKSPARTGPMRFIPS